MTVNKKRFIHLKVRSHYSILEGSMKVADIVEAAKKMKMPAIALTDDTNVFGAMEFTTLCLNSGIQPIIGCILRINKNNTNQKIAQSLKEYDFQITLLVKDNDGWKNLSSLISKAYYNYKIKGKKCINIKDLINYNKGLICLFSDLKEIDNSYHSTYLENKSISLSLSEIFENRFYIDLFRDNTANCLNKESFLLKLSNELNIPLTCSNDIYFFNKDIYEAHECLNCISQSTTIVDPNRKKSNIESYFKDSSLMNKLFFDIPEAIENAINIAKRCSFILKEKEPKLPKVFTTNNNDENKTLIFQATKGLLKRLNVNSFYTNDKNLLDYKNRLDFELKVISDMGYSGYFLIVSDFISWAKKNRIPVGPGRGSGAGSIVAWSLNITNLDPIKYGLLFERFLNPERVSLPDFDIDFCTLRRDEVIAYVRNKYGEDKVAQIITFGSLQPKAAIRDVGRVLGINYGIVDKLAKTIPNIIQGNTNLNELYENNIAMQNMIKGNEELEKLFEISVKLEGLNRNASTHAAGLVISNSTIKSDVPLYYDLKSEFPATQFTMKFIEKIGLVKFDFLGVETLTIIDKALKDIEKRGIKINIDDIDLNDNLTYKNLGKGNTLGVFQLESVPMQNILKELRPDRIEDIIAVVALYRPGPMENIPDYIKRKHNNSLTKYQHPLLEPVLKETFGIMIYQEQVMEAAKVLAGFSLAKADLLRRAIGKKIRSEMDSLKESFIEGCLKNNINEKDSKKIFQDIEKFAGYGFNKSHAAAYAIISYQTAWCKTNYPVEYFTSLLNSEAAKSGEKLLPLTLELSRLNIKILPSDINFSDVGFTVEKHKDELCIRSGLANIKNVGIELARFIVQDRKQNGLYESIISFFTRMDDKVINKRQIEFLAMAGVFDKIFKDRSTIFESASKLVALSQNSQRDRDTCQQVLFGSELNTSNTSNILKQAITWCNSKCLINEYASLGFFISKNPLIEKRSFFKKFNLSNSISIENNKINGKLFELIGFLVKVEEKVINNKKVLDLLFVDEWSYFNLFVFIDSSVAEKDLAIPGESYVITVVNTIDTDRRMRLRLKSIREISSFMQKVPSNLKIYLNNLNEIEKLKAKLEIIKEGKNNVIIVYNGYEVDTGIKVDNKYVPFNDLNLLDGVEAKSMIH